MIIERNVPIPTAVEYGVPILTTAQYDLKHKYPCVIRSIGERLNDGVVVKRTMKKKCVVYVVERTFIAVACKP